MKCETKDEEEIKKFVEFCKELVSAASEDVGGTLTVNNSGISYVTGSGKGRYFLTFYDVLMFSGRRRSFHDGVWAYEKAFYPDYKKWTMTETSMPELPLGDINYSYKSDEEYEEERNDK